MRISLISIPFVLSCVINVHAVAETSPYVGEESRAIKALSTSEIDGLLQGKGMGLARAAELNGYPGPMHVLELSEELGLSEEQIAGTRAIRERMLASATKLGAELVEAERSLDDLFRSQLANQKALDDQMARIGELQTKIRGAHLRAHIEQKMLLSPEQVAKYSELRGYAASHGEHQHGHHDHHAHGH
jgi:Spy/CpxP family protein refolding chaperone